MKFVGIDLHKKSIAVCVVDGQRKVLGRRKLYCSEPEKIVAAFQEFAPFQAVVEATASYEWLFDLLEPIADKLVLAHPGKLRVIAESVKKTDKLDALVLAEFLAMGITPTAYRPTQRQREHRTLVRQRVRVQQKRSRVMCRLRQLLAAYNADRADLFTGEGMAFLKAYALSAADRFVRAQLVAEYELLTAQRTELDKELTRFAKAGSLKEAEARAVLETIPGVGPVTINVVLAELGDIDRFGSQKKACAYAGLQPIVRESAGKSRELRISKQGSPILRRALVEAAWQMVRYSRKWSAIFQNLAKRRGKKRAIIAVARRLLGMMVAMIQQGKPYDHLRAGEAPPAAKAAKRKTDDKAVSSKRGRRRAKGELVAMQPANAESLEDW